VPQVLNQLKQKAFEYPVVQELEALTLRLKRLVGR
jgi:hypothetical protein